MQKYQTAAARIMLALVFLLPVIITINAITSVPNGYMAYQNLLNDLGLRSFFAPVILITKLFGGIALLLGYKTKVVAIILMIFAIFLGIVVSQQSIDSFFLHLGIAGGLLLLSCYPHTAYSLDSMKK